MTAPFTTELTYVRLYADAAGVSRFADEKFELRPGGAKSGEGALASYAIPNVQSGSFVALKTGAVEDWHLAPRRQFIIGLRGEAEITAGSGEVRHVRPGSVFLVEDTTGGGHITRSIGTEDHIAIVVPVPAA